MLNALKKTPFVLYNRLEISVLSSGESEIPAAGGRRYLGALPGGPCNDMIHSRRA